MQNMVGVAHMEEKVQNALQNCSGENFEKFIHKEFSDINAHYTILTLNILARIIVKFPSTTALKGIIDFFFHLNWHHQRGGEDRSMGLSYCHCHD